jgi:hypothetical protein
MAHSGFLSVAAKWTEQKISRRFGFIEYTVAIVRVAQDR